MIDLIEITASDGSLLSLSLEDTSSGYVVRGIEGLDPVKADLTSSAFGQLDGAQYQAGRRETRNIVFTLGFDPDWIYNTVESLRQDLYTYFMPKSSINLKFYTEAGLSVQIAGVVESMGQPQFTNDPEASISIICFDPDFQALDSITRTALTTDFMTAQSTAINYEGTIPTGFKFNIAVTRQVYGFTIYSIAPDGSTYSFNYTAELQDGYSVMIDTINGEKDAQQYSGPYLASGMPSVDIYSDWIQLFPGLNLIRVEAGGAGIPYTVEYTPRYGGL